MVRNKDALLQSLNWPRRSARVTDSLAQTDVSFCQSKMLYILDNVNLCVYDVHFDCGAPIQSYASLVYLGRHASRKMQSWQKVSHFLGHEYRVVTRRFRQSALCSCKNTL